MKNAALIRDFIKDVTPEEVVMEMCDERFDEEIRDIITHPNYDKVINKVQKLLREDKPEFVTELNEIAVD